MDKDAANVRLPPPLLPLATVLIGVAIGSRWPLTMPVTDIAAVLFGVGTVLLVATVALAAWAVHVMRRSGQSELPWTPSTSIVRAGPYRFTRNPMYLAMVVSCVAFAFLLQNAWILILTPLCAWLLLVIAIVPEERYLEAKFGDAYLGYQRSVRRWL